MEDLTSQDMLSTGDYNSQNPTACYAHSSQQLTVPFIDLALAPFTLARLSITAQSLAAPCHKAEVKVEAEHAFVDKL